MIKQSIPIETISKVIYSPHKSLCLKLKVLLGQKDKAGRRKKFITAFQYQTAKYGGNKEPFRAMNVSTGEFLILESVLSYELRTQNPGLRPYSIWFSYENLYLLKDLLGLAIEWVTTNTKLFKFDEIGDVIGLKPMASTTFKTIDSKVMHKFSEHMLTITPTLRVIPETNGYERAVNILMGQSKLQVCTLSEYKLRGLLDTINNFDISNNSQLLVNQVLISELFKQNSKTD